MHLARDEFSIEYDSTKKTESDLIATIKDAGYKSYVVKGDVKAVTPIDPKASADDPLYIGALVRAKREGKPIILDFHASWCAPCKKMEKETFADSDVMAQLDKVIFVKIDTDVHPDFAKHFRVAGLPDIRYLDSNGKQVLPPTHVQNVKQFSQSIQELILSAGKSEHKK